MKIKIDQNHENDQPEENEAWRKLLKQNAEIMAACIREFPSKPECVWISLFRSVVPSASQGDIGKLLKMGFDVLGKADKPIKSTDNPITFDNYVEPPEPPPGFFATAGLRSMPGPPPGIPKPPPAVESVYITVGTTATLLYENQSGKSRRISVSNDDVVKDMWIGTQNVNQHLGNIIPKTERRAVDVPAGRFLWGITSAGTIRVRIGLSDGYAVPGITIFLKDIFEPTSDDGPVCWLCGSSDLTQAIYLMEGSERKKQYVCLKCVRNLVTDYRESLKELVPDSDSIPDDKPVCCLCDSGHLLQTVYLSGDVTGDSYIIPSTGKTVSLSESYICMECLRKLIERERRNAG